MCGTVGQGANDPLVKGMFRSIVFMVAMPFVVFGAVAGWLWFKVRRLSVDPEARVRPVAGEWSEETAK